MDCGRQVKCIVQGQVTISQSWSLIPDAQSADVSAQLVKKYLLDAQHPRLRKSQKKDNRVIFNTTRASPLLLEGEQTGTVGETVVVGVDAGVATLVEELEVAGVDGEGLVGAGSDELSVADVVGPGGTAVGLAGEGVALGGSVGGPLAVEAVGDLDGLEEVLLGVRHDDLRGGAEAAGEVANGHAGAVDLAVITAEEQVHVLAVSNDGLVNGASAGVGDVAGEESLGSRPAVGVGRVAGGSVGELLRTPLVSQNPDVLGLEEEQGRGNGQRVHAGLGGGTELVDVGDGAEGHGAPAGAEDGGVDELAAVVGRDGEVLEREPRGLGLGEGIAGCPLVAGGESTLGRDVTDGGEEHQARGENVVVEELHDE
ncbi:hypothetical protein HG530_007099 [Fusarium avenaceum]|nr:hypothetical protein HG530_007099 [Fusarium avenaceum]